MLTSIFILLFFVLTLTLASADDKSLSIKSAERMIDLTTSIARHTTTLTLLNEGTSSVATFRVAFESTAAPSLAYVAVDDEAGLPLRVVLERNATKSGKSGKAAAAAAAAAAPTAADAQLFRVHLPRPLAASATATVTVHAAFTHRMTPFPTHITQNEHQLVRYADNHYVYASYKVATQKTTVKMNAGVLESHSELAPTLAKFGQIVYGPYEAVAPFAYSPLAAHFENNAPFTHVTEMSKWIEVSHWGANVAVEESYKVLHGGATLKGSFSRYDYQRNAAGSQSAVRFFRARLPAGAADIYYRDEIGNISTSALTPTSDGALEMDIVPRFVLFGGWRTNFLTGYNLPATRYLFVDATDGALHMLNVTVLANFVTPMAVDWLTVRVVLPEGGSDIELHAPFDVERVRFETLKTYLDTSGRPVLVFEKRNLVGEHNQYFQVTYRFSTLSMLREPALLVGTIFALCLAVIAYARLDFSLAPRAGSGVGALLLARVVREVKPRANAAEAIKAKETSEAYADVLERRVRAHESMQTLLSKVKGSKTKTIDSKQFAAELVACRQDAAQLITKLDAAAPSMAAKLRDIEKLENNKAEVHKSLIQATIAARSGDSDGVELAQQKFDDAEEAVEKALQELF